MIGVDYFCFYFCFYFLEEGCVGCMGRAREKIKQRTGYGA